MSEDTEQDPQSSIRFVIHGDDTEPIISAASVIAKVSRDKYMDRQDSKYRNYGFAQHKGYVTEAHVRALNELGPCAIHRKTCEPVKTLLLHLNKH